MQLWPFYMALTGALAAVTWFTDRQAFWAYAAILCGLLAMRAGSAFPPLFALTVWSVIAAILISLGVSIAAGICAVIVALAYLPAVFGLPWSHAAFASDVAGVCLLACLAFPTGLALVGPDRSGPGFMHHRPLPAWPMAALQALARTQKGATSAALERDL